MLFDDAAIGITFGVAIGAAVGAVINGNDRLWSACLTLRTITLFGRTKRRPPLIAA